MGPNNGHQINKEIISKIVYFSQNIDNMIQMRKILDQYLPIYPLYRG